MAATRKKAKIDPVTQKRAAAQQKLAAGLCMVAGCENASFSRGNCQTHLRERTDAVRAGEVTDKWLVENVEILPARQAGRPRTAKV